MVAFFTALVVLVVLVAIGMWYGSRRPVGASLTWGQAMVAAVYVFFVTLWMYAMVPHLFLSWADNELKWRPDALMYQYWKFLGFLKPQTAGGWFPITISMQTIRDLVVVTIYAVFLGFNIWVYAWWNNRGKRTEEKAKELETSDYGRPLVRKA